MDPKHFNISTMIKLYLTVTILSLSFVGSAYAEKSLDDFSLMREAVEYSAKADAYNEYCEQSSSMASDFIDKFEKRGALTPQQKQELIALQATQSKTELSSLQAEEVVCKDLQFMLKRLEVMRKLKDVSYLLNGVDPSTIPEKTIPNLEDLLPPKATSMPSKDGSFDL